MSRKPRLYKGMGYAYPKEGVMAVYVPNDDFQGTKLYVLRLTAQTQPVAYLLRRLIEEATRKKWYERLWDKLRKAEDPKKKIAQMFELPKEEGGARQKPGKVARAGKKPEYNPTRKRGAIKVMPRNLRRMKEGQESQ